ALSYTAGAFSSAGAPAPSTLGSIDLSLQCASIGLDFTPADGSGLDAASFTFLPGGGLDQLGAAECTPALASCPTGTTAAGADCVLPNEITSDLFLPAGKKYIVSGRVSVEAGGTLTIAPGVTVQGSDDTALANFILVKADGRI